MNFAILGHLMYEGQAEQMPQDWIRDNLVVSPQFSFDGTKGNLIALKLSAKQMVEMPIEQVRQKVLDAAVFAQDEFGAELIQLGALTTSVTSGGKWLIEQKEYTGYANHGDSYTAAVTCQAVLKAINLAGFQPSRLTLAIVGAYGVIGEAVSRILVPQFGHSILIGRKAEKFEKLEKELTGNYETTTDLKTKEADIIVTATNHPTALLKSEHLKKNAIVVDVSQPPNVSPELCKQRQDIIRIDGGFVDFPVKYDLGIPGMPKGKNFACIVEVIMQALENEKANHVGSIDLNHLMKTEKWARKYGFILNELTNFGMPITIPKETR
ncbi:hypothetical protein J7K18_01820 [bacterium]|nr:hypothetical protein [bacterium]